MGTVLFVYGSLRRNCWNSHFLANAEFLGEGQTAGRSTLLIEPISGLPYLTLEPRCKVQGELFRVSAKELVEIDCLEGDPDSYMRMPLDIEKSDGNIIEAETYVWLHSTTDLEPVPSGNWLDTLADQLG